MLALTSTNVALTIGIVTLVSALILTCVYANLTSSWHTTKKSL